MPPGERAGSADRLRRLLGEDDLAWLLTRLRARLEAGQELTGAVALRAATPEQRSAVARLFGAPLRPGAGVSVRLADLDAELRRSGAWTAGLEEAVVALTGPYRRRADLADVQRAAWASAWSVVADAVTAHPEPGLRSPLQAWWQRELDTGAARRAAGSPEAATVLARQLAAVLVRLPASGVAVGALANEATGSAHALDRGALAGLVLRAARAMTGLASPPQRTAESDREAWAAVGVVRDEVSSTVLVLGLPAAPEAAAGRALAAWREVGQPVVLTLRQLRLDPPRWEPPGAGTGVGLGAGVVWSVENPVVLTAVADRAGELGAAAPPVVCTAGRPSAAAVGVLRGLRAAGWVVRHHGDLDPDGVAITEWLLREVGARPWRMSAQDHLRAVAAGRGRPAAVGEVAASWDDALGPAMARSGQVVEEEAVLEDLLADVLPG